jgi:tetratricopeptide (TPR) repeat protein
MTNSSEDDKLAYLVAKHFKSLGSKSRLSKTDSSATVLTKVASYYKQRSRFEESRLYAQAAVSSARKNSCVFGLANAQLFSALAGLQVSAVGGPGPSILESYRNGKAVLEWNWGEYSPLLMTLHDAMSEVYHKAKDPERAYEFHHQSLRIANQSLGDNHVVTAAYLTRAGCYSANMGNSDIAIQNFTLALEIFQSTYAEASLTAEVHYHMADALEQKGDYDGAVEHAQICRKMREGAFGFADIRVIHSCRQLSRLLLAPYRDYKGILTPAIRNAYKEAISCNEKIFRFLQNQQALARRKSRKVSRPVKVQEGIVDTTIGKRISGPLLQPPYGWTSPFPKNLLHRLTKEIVQMKLALVESPQHREYIRTLRQKRQESCLEFDPDEAKATILKMAAVSPSVFLDDIFVRIAQGDETAVEELGIVIFLTENETVTAR